MGQAMKVHVLQHVPFENIGCISDWLAAREITPSYTRLFEHPRLPDPAGLGLLIVLGGPMSVHDQGRYPWLRDELAFIQAAMQQGTAVLGVCLGAQLIAQASGVRVYPNAEREIGWWPIEAVGRDGAGFRFPASSRVFHWHGETFDLPPQAVPLARSAGCVQQAFQLGRRVIGLQFHLETTPETVNALLTHCPDDLRPGRFVQSAQAMRDEPPATRMAANRLLAELLDYLVG